MVINPEVVTVILTGFLYRSTTFTPATHSLNRPPDRYNFRQSKGMTVILKFESLKKMTPLYAPTGGTFVRGTTGMLPERRITCHSRIEGLL